MKGEGARDVRGSGVWGRGYVCLKRRRRVGEGKGKGIELIDRWICLFLLVFVFAIAITITIARFLYTPLSLWGSDGHRHGHE